MELLDALAFLDETCKAYTNQNLENNNKALKKSHFCLKKSQNNELFTLVYKKNSKLKLGLRYMDREGIIKFC